MSASRAFTLDKQLFNPSLYSRLISFWFENLSRTASAPGEQQMFRWFGVGLGESARASFDEQCSTGFRSALSSIGPDKFSLPESTDLDADGRNYSRIASPFISQFTQNNSITESHEAALGLMLLLDQMPRNIFRKQQALIYGHYDRISRAIFQDLYSRGLDKFDQYTKSPAWRVWTYMPLMHSESLQDHETLIREFQALKSKAEEAKDEAAVNYMSLTMEFEKKHGDILREFGRYPYRNEVLGRQTTAKEREWLGSGGDTFGA